MDQKLAAIYNLYFDPGKTGESIYDARFGDYDIPLIEVITVGNLAIDQLTKRSTHYSEDLSAYDQEEFISGLVSELKDSQMGARDLYALVIKKLAQARNVMQIAPPPTTYARFQF